MPASMTLRQVADGAVDVALVGRLDTPGVEDIETRFTAAIGGENANAIVDLSRVDFVGSMAIRMFLSVARSQAKQKRRLVLYAPQPQVRESFETVSLDSLIPIAADGPAALQALRG